jgi:hypothetical protein
MGYTGLLGFNSGKNPAFIHSPTAFALFTPFNFSSFD